jgi:predicted RNA binding protein YcfA (HicA-like mRNA interferase family)
MNGTALGRVEQSGSHAQLKHQAPASTDGRFGD